MTISKVHRNEIFEWEKGKISGSFGPRYFPLSLSLSLKHILSLLHTHTSHKDLSLTPIHFTRTYSISLLYPRPRILSISHRLFFSLSHTLLLTYTLYHSYTSTHAYFLSQIDSFSHYLIHYYSHRLLSLIHTHTTVSHRLFLSLKCISLTHSPFISLPHRLFLSLTHTHTHTHTLGLSFFLAHSIIPSHSLTEEVVHISTIFLFVSKAIHKRTIHSSLFFLG